MNTINKCMECYGTGHIRANGYAICCPNCKGYGKIGFTSTSMGVNTKPAHRLDFNGHWILIDSTIPESKLEHIKDLINQIKP